LVSSFTQFIAVRRPFDRVTAFGYLSRLYFFNNWSPLDLRRLILLAGVRHAFPCRIAFLLANETTDAYDDFLR
jgi:hypothetical protein